MIFDRLLKKDRNEEAESNNNFRERENNIIGEKEIEKATQTLLKYKNGKANLEKLIIENELWYKLRHWDVMRKGEKKKPTTAPEPSSAWLFNVVANKHADAMDNYPEPIVLPREESDAESANTLSEILPVILERCDFETTYSKNWWEKIKHGTAAYGVFWNPAKDNGIGDIEIRPIDLLNIFWEPGVSDIQDSANLFIVALRDREQLEREYPALKDNSGQGTIKIEEYIHDDNIDTSEKAVIVDWYYKIKENGKTILHFCKFCGSEVLFSTENEGYTDGWYAHGKYPVIFDSLFPEKDSPCGFGYISIAKDPQMYIDKLSQFMLQSAMMGSKVRYMISDSSGINEEEFADWSKDIVHCTGNINDDKAMQIKPQPVSSIYYNILEFKTNELKETSQNRDVSQGSSGAGITAASAIAALQEAGNKTSRDMISASYNSYREICYQMIELIRQFYTEVRAFRITGENGEERFTEFKNDSITMQQDGEFFRAPIFDIKIKAQKKSAFSTMSQNELAKELYNMGFFSPERAQEALGAVSMMTFEGKDNVMGFIQQGQTLTNVLDEMRAQMEQMAQVIQEMTGVAAPQAGEAEQTESRAEYKPTKKADPEGQAARTPYAERLAKRSVPDMNAGAVQDLA